MRLLVVVVVVLLSVADSRAQTKDHLSCFKVKDPQAKTTYRAEVDGLVAEPGCLIKVPAVMACVPAAKSNVQPTPPGGGGTGTPNGFFCYKLHCPSATVPALAGQDQFGSRTVTPGAVKFLCAPLAGPPTTTTTTVTTTTTATTTATLHFAPCFFQGACGSCGDGQCALHCGSAPFSSGACVELDALGPCDSDSDCPTGYACASFGFVPGGCTESGCFRTCP